MLNAALILPSTAYLLVFHGSRDPRPQVAVETLATLLSQALFSEKNQPAQLPTQRDTQADSAFAESSQAERNAAAGLATIAPFSDPASLPCRSWVGTASLECSPLPLHQQIQQFAEALPTVASAEQHSSDLRTSDLRTSDLRNIVLLPLFLLPGVHVMEDIPAQVAVAQAALGPTVTIDLRPHLGSHRRLPHLVRQWMAEISADAWILLAHGSRRAGANQPIAVLADHVGASVAYWSVPPSLETCLQALLQQGVKKIAILPYFLFSGGITDAIAQQVDRASHIFPTLELQLAAPLEVSLELVDLLHDLAINPDEK